MTSIKRIIRSPNESIVATGSSLSARSGRMAHLGRIACIFVAAFLTCATVVSADNHLIIKRSANSVSETVDRLSDALKARGISIVTRIDHAAAAARSGLSLRPTMLLIFGNPKLGTPLMQSNPSVGLDLPMKVLIWQDEGGQVWLGYAKPERLKTDHGLKDQEATLQQMADALNKLTEEAIRGK